MKKILYLFLVISFSAISYSQCISGPTTLYVGQTYTFTSIATAQCTGCYDWDINNNSSSSDNSIVGNLQIVNSDTGQSVSIRILSAGSFTINLTYFTEAGCQSCSRTYTPIVPVPLPSTNCFGFDPVNPSDINSEGTLNYGYLGGPYQPPLPSTGLTFAWSFLFLDGTLLNFSVQNPTFRELCPTNPVKSFACVVSNGVQTKQYRSIAAGFPIPGISGPNTPTCFLHSDCSLGLRIGNLNPVKIGVFPNPTSSFINFDGVNLEKHFITIYDVNGKKIIDNCKIDKPISLNDAAKGLLLYTISFENEIVQEGKLIKE